MAGCTDMKLAGSVRRAGAWRQAKSSFIVTLPAASGRLGQVIEIAFLRWFKMAFHEFSVC